MYYGLYKLFKFSYSEAVSDITNRSDLKNIFRVNKKPRKTKNRMTLRIFLILKDNLKVFFHIDLPERISCLFIDSFIIVALELISSLP